MGILCVFAEKENKTLGKEETGESHRQGKIMHEY